MKEHERGLHIQTQRESLKQLNTIETKQSNNNNKLQWRATEQSLKVGAQSEDTEQIMDALYGPDGPQLYSLLLSGNSAPTDVFTQPLLPVINELSACVCGNNWRFILETYVQGLWLSGGLNLLILSESVRTYL